VWRSTTYACTHYCTTLHLQLNSSFLLPTGLQAKGMPWCVAKGYDTFLPYSEFVDVSEVEDHTALTLWLDVNGERRQTALVNEMIYKLPFLIKYISNIFTLEEGDMIITGTPEGVAAVFPGDVMTAGVVGMPVFDMAVKVVE
jgi:acylpyruvate hydrolase